ncbi:hypothetical protein [Arundinibacter roseus]|uniref:Uncharacterized protein n=1 Tax=Arundinibacter roseus TaxID=2070510 RepID=A0A4R4KFW8_9BACT|nr:hypothetical protein [Arundinibacter roseus]TDB66900.1 hypothetical protein EZE20_07180 [Arundinibacter roseus]
MTKLSSQWLTDGILDFEYKKYVLLAYLQHVKSDFSNQMLFPHLPQLHEHYQSSLSIRQNQRSLRKSFPKSLTDVDWKRLQLIYKEEYEDSPHLEEINGILEFAIPRFSETLQEGKSRLEEVQSALTIAPVGIIPLRSDEGYLFIHRTKSRELSIFRYQMTLFDAQKERMVQTYPVDSLRKSVHSTYESMKVELTRRFTYMPNPATYLVESPAELPMDETLLPVAKKLMIRYIHAG